MMILSRTAFLAPHPLSVQRPRYSPCNYQCPVPQITSLRARNNSVAFVLSHFEARDLLNLQGSVSEHGTHLVHGSFSVDLGKRALETLVVHPKGISLNEKQTMSRVLATWSELKKMSRKGRTGAYEVFLDGISQPEKIAGLSMETNMPASLFPVSPHTPPTLILGGFGMHRMKDTNPAADTASKIAAIGETHLRGHVLDICTGLGYTAIEASRANSVIHVTTVEVDPFVVDVQRRNPWSEELFKSRKIRRVVDNAGEAVKQFPDATFDSIIHDPPAQVIGGDLYAVAFYKELSRICVPGGKLFHYIGDPNSIESGRLFRGVTERLENAGFRKITKHSNAYGLTAICG